MVSLVAVVLFVVSAMVVDLGLARDTKRQSQNAADAAALAAGNKLYDANGTVQFAAAVSEAKSYSLTNFGVAADRVDRVHGRRRAGLRARPPPRPASPSTAPPSRRWSASRSRAKTLKPGLGTLSGVGTITVDSAARVALEPPGLPCIVCVLGSGQTHDLQNGDVTVDGGNVHFNGSVSVDTNGFVVTNGHITVEGSASNPTSNFTPDAAAGQPAIVGPARLPTLPPAHVRAARSRANPCTDGPGKYGSFNIPNALCTLPARPLRHRRLRGTQWAPGGNATSVLAGSGVTLYFTCGTPAAPVACGTGETGATLDATGNGSIALSPPTTGPLRASRSPSTATTPRRCG